MDMDTFSVIIFVVYFLGLVYITVYCLMQSHLLYYYKKNGSNLPKEPVEVADTDSDELPFVTVQLPIFNEMYVVERLIENIANFNYPRDRFEIHVLDDSTDETTRIAKAKVDEYKSKGYQIDYIHRTNRVGYKAGALKEGMDQARGEFIAIFDADFLPYPDFLRKTIGYFKDPKIGVVQTRWEHINKDYSLLTRLQAMQLDVHFTVEQKGRFSGDCLLQFNGTAGVWRRKTIEDAGGWEADTLTEDLDLSYRAQLKGWRIAYLEDVGSPAELPSEMNGLKSQQFRWTKGGAETAKKMLPTIWKAKIPLRQKVHGTVHLMGSSIFISVLLTAILSVPIMFYIEDLSINFTYGAVFYLAIVALVSVYYVANVQASRGDDGYFKTLFKFIFLFPMFLSLSMGLSLHNTIAVIQGYLGKKSAFIRTPKFNIKGLSDTFKQRKYLEGKISWVTIMEGLLALYFLVAAVYGPTTTGTYAFFVYHLMLAFGFGAICYYSVRHLRLRR
ncbi:MAG: cellulose synthase family protein [Bacteroidota bacterium]